MQKSTLNQFRIGNYLEANIKNEYDGQKKWETIIVSGLQSNSGFNEDEDKIYFIDSDIATFNKFRKYTTLDSDYLRGIPLTEKWLINFGGKPLKNGYWIDLTNLKSELHFETFDNTDEIVTTIKGPFSDLILDRIKHVHQLQNLYFSLTGTELLFAKSKN